MGLESIGPPAAELALGGMAIKGQEAAVVRAYEQLANTQSVSLFGGSAGGVCEGATARGHIGSSRSMGMSQELSLP